MTHTRLLICALALALPAVAHGANPVVILDTSYGKIKIELFEDKTPITVKNFLQYADDKHYDGTIFHRVVADMVIQGGGYTPLMDERKTRPPIKNESNKDLKNLRGTIGMARTTDPDSATSQFFINVVDNPPFDVTATNPGYCVFGRVVDGMEVVDRIRKVTTVPSYASQNLPIEDIVVKSVQREKK